jgi:hypothetical protein
MLCWEFHPSIENSYSLEIMVSSGERKGEGIYKKRMENIEKKLGEI